MRIGYHYIGGPIPIGAAQYWGDNAQFDVKHDRQYRTLQQLLPQGRIWPKRDEATFNKLLNGLSGTFRRTEQEIDRLLAEADPRSAQETLEDWEDFVGVEPAESATLAQRQAVVAQKLAFQFQQTPAAFQALAEAYGYIGVTINRNLGSPFLCTSECTHVLQGKFWLFTWSLTTTNTLGPELDEDFRTLIRSLSKAYGTVIITLGS